MAAATHAHYIRTIHTSFTAAHPHSAASSAWASASASSQYLNHYQHQRPQPQQQNASINTHNTHMYTHHLRDLTHSHSHSHGHRQGQVQPPQLMMTQQGQYIPATTPGSRKGVVSETTLAQPTPTPTPTRSAPSPPPPPSLLSSSLSMSSPIPEPVAHRTRRRSLSIRMPPSTAYTYKFDPFADEPITPVLALPRPSALPAASAEDMDVDAPRPQLHEAPYTIHIPAAQQVDIQLYTSSPPPLPRTPRLAAASLPPPRPTAATTAATPSRPLSPRAPTFTPRRSPSPPSAPSPSSFHAHSPPPNLSKVVANILLNRVTAGARQRGAAGMRRRAMGGHEGGYVKSCLSRVVCVEA